MPGDLAEMRSGVIWGERKEVDPLFPNSREVNNRGTIEGKLHSMMAPKYLG